MRWSKVKKEVESRFSPNLKGRISLHITSYGSDNDVSDLYNRGWITVDGKEVANFATPDSFFLKGRDYNASTPIDFTIPDEEYYTTRSSNTLSEKGEFSKYDLSHCCFAYLNLSINEALHHKSPIIKTFSVLDKRVGKRRLLKMDESTMHPLVQFFFKLRLAAEHLLDNVE